MTTRYRHPINPDLLHWALERAGISTDGLAEKFPKLNDWLRGKLAPTFKQLKSFANATHTAFGMLYLSQPPEESLPIPDLRTLPDARLSRPSGGLLDTIYICQRRQDWYRDYQWTHGEEPVTFVRSASVADDVSRVVTGIIQATGFDLAERRKVLNGSEVLRRFISQVEQAGILVMVSGVVGSNTHRPLNVKEFRGFALADPMAPLVFINGKGSRAAQMFTLACELAHLWLGESGVSDAKAATEPDGPVGRWCNAVAAELLVRLEHLRPAYDPGTELEGVKTLASREVRGDSFYNMLFARTGKPFVRALVASTLEGQTLFTDAFRMLGIKKTATFYQVAQRLGLHG